jgi:hypothetical protein
MTRAGGRERVHRNIRAGADKLAGRVELKVASYFTRAIFFSIRQGDIASECRGRVAN